MTHWYDIRPTFTEDGDTIVVGRPAFVASFHSEPGLAQHAAAILDAWLALLPPDTTLWYSHEKTRQYLKLTLKALARIRVDFSVKSLDQKYASYLIKSAPEGGPVDECHRYSFEMYAVDGHSGYVFLTLPLDHVEEQGPDLVVRWFGDWCARFAFTHAGAGYGYEQAWFGEQSQCVGPAMLSVALRFHGVRAWVRSTARFRTLGKTTLDTAAWMTFLDAGSVNDVGAESLGRIDRRVSQYKIGSGVLLRAGETPDPGDSNRRNDAYAMLKSVNDCIVPIRTTKWYQNYWGTPDDPEKEDRWFRRMDR